MSILVWLVVATYIVIFIYREFDIPGFIRDLRWEWRWRKEHRMTKRLDDPSLKKLGLSCHVGGFQTGVGYFSTKLTQSPAATAILELLKDALNELGVPIKFNEIRHSRGPGGHDPDPFSLAMTVGNFNIQIAVRIDGEGRSLQFCGFVPEETSGGFGIMIYVQESAYDYYFKEISCATHYADPNFDPEVTVGEIKKIIDGLPKN